MRKIAFICFLVSVLFSVAQEKVGIVEIIDDLTVKWDREAFKLRTYQGVQNFCATKDYRTKTIGLLDQIHHWDTSLYFIVKEKYASSEDEEAAATLRDIETLEVQYTTENFKVFIDEECSTLKEIESHFDAETVRAYEKEIKQFEKELVKYITTITNRIDIIDEHIHHLKLD